MFETAFTYRTAGEINSAMLRVYNYMMMAILTSGLVAGMVASDQELIAFLFTGIMKWVVMLAPIAAVILITIALNADPPKSVAIGLLLGFAAVMGLSLSVFFYAFTTGSIVGAFFSASLLFGIMSMYGYFTKRSLESLGQFLFVGLITIIVVSLVNIWIGSSVLQMVVSAVAILIFLGLTAYDTQQIREAISQDGQDGHSEVVGALTLYLDFINIFINLLQLFGIQTGKNND